MSQSLELDPVLVQPLRRPERRTARRPRAQQQPLVRPGILKAAAAIIAGGVLFAFAGQIVAAATEPVVATYRTGQEIQRLEKVLAAEKSTNEQLKADIAYLSTRAGTEQEARRRGWVLPGEVALTIVIPPVEPIKAHKPILARQPAGAPRAVADRLRDAVDTTLAVLGGHAPKTAP